MAESDLKKNLLEDTQTVDQFLTLKDLNIQIKRGEFVCISDIEIQNLEKKQCALKDSLVYLLALESVISGIYSGISTVAMKLLANSLSEQEDFFNKYWAIALSALMLIFSVLFNMSTLNHILSLYPSLKAVPCY